MNPTEVEANKVAGHSEHLLAFCIALVRKAKIADALLMKSFGSTFDRPFASTGFEVAREAIYFSVVQDLAAIIYDKDKRTPSVVSCLEKLKKPDIVGYFRDLFVEEPGVETALKKRLEADNSLRFKKLISNFLFEAEDLVASEKAKACLVTRNEFVAHYQLNPSEGGYIRPDIAQFGLTWGTPKAVIEQLVPIVEAISVITRNTGFAWQIYDEQNEKIVNDLVLALGGSAS